MISQHDSFLILNAIPGLGPIRIKKLVNHFSNPAKVLSASAQSLWQTGIVSQKIARNIVRFDPCAFLEKEYRAASQQGIDMITIDESRYPSALREIVDPPPVLYIKGNITDEDQTALALVGSRRASVYGIAIAEKFALQLSDYGITVVSGMARGIDTAAHRGALRARGRTIAVLGSGFLNIYPKENKKLSEKIADHGVVVSEFPMETAPLSGNFPRRNRIISGLSLGVIVVEAAKKSGALITADFALEQGKDVFAVPGKVDSPSSFGVNNLIKQGAKLISSIEDVVEELGLEIKRSLENQPKSFLSQEGLTDIEAKVFSFIPASGIALDVLMDHCQISFPKLSRALISLTLKKRIKQLPGKIFAQS